MPAEPAPEPTETPVGVTQSTMPTAPADAADEATTATFSPSLIGTFEQFGVNAPRYTVAGDGRTRGLSF